MTPIRLALLFCLCTLTSGVAAETLYVTDRVLAEVHATPQARGEPLAVLPTGATVEVLETRGDRVRVQAPGVPEGWMDRRLLTKQPPAMALVLKLREQQARTQEELDRLKSERRTVSLWAMAAVGVACLLIGFVIGVLWLDHRIRERHGGFRI
ncbi:MAG: SH3 domain-containing protein [Thiohalomonadaceae bacterium]